MLISYKFLDLLGIKKVNFAGEKYKIFQGYISTIYSYNLFQIHNFFSLFARGNVKIYSEEGFVCQKN